MKKFIAFTLAEVLITIGIIGVVAALTTPVLVANYQKKAMSTKFKKVTNEFSSNVDMFITEEGATKLTGTSIFSNTLPNGTAVTDGLTNFIENKFKVIMKCDSGSSGCFAPQYRALSGSETKTSADICSTTAYKLADGSVVCVTKGTDSLSVTVDLNGISNPNAAGRDLFQFSVNNNAAPEPIGEASACTTNATGEGCYKALIEDNWTMKY